MKTTLLRHAVVSLAILVALVLFSACSGLGNGQSTLTGSIVSVNASTGTVVISVNGHQDIISHVPANVIQSLQNQVGHVYTVTVTTNSDGSFSIVSNSPITADNNEGTPTANETSSSNQTPTTAIDPGSIEFSGNVQSVGNNSLVVSLPTGSTLSLVTSGSTDLGDFNNALPAVNTQVKVKAAANADGSFTATKVGHADSTDATIQAKFTGVTTAAVGPDHVLHFTVGNKSFSFPIASTADLKDFNGNAQSIQSGASVKVNVQFNSTVGTATDVGLNSGK